MGILNQTDEPHPDTIIVGNVQITFTLSDKRQINSTVYLYAKDGPAEINERVDMMQEVLERQFIRVDVVTKEAEKFAAELGFDAYMEHFGSIADKKKAGKLLSSQDKTQLEQHDLAVRNFKLRQKTLAEQILAGRKKLNGAAPA
jgi:hypothetical protein